eukprot:15242057-Alexandrium_andersonii.AAC.1
MRDDDSEDRTLKTAVIPQRPPPPARSINELDVMALDPPAEQPQADDALPERWVPTDATAQ